MVSSPHEAMHRIFEQDPGVFARAVRALGVPFEDPVSATPFPTDLTENRPLERRVDTLLRIHARGHSFLLAVEAQGKKDPGKPKDWAYYLAHLNAKYLMPSLLLVVCQDRSTAAWASETVNFGPPQWPALTLRPLVLGPDNVPVIDDPIKAASDIPLTVLSAVLHGRDPGVDAILKALAAALKGLEVRDPETAEIFVELTSQGLGKAPAANLWRDLVTDLSFFTSPLSQELRAEGHSEGLAEGLAKGVAQGVTQGVAKGLVEAQIKDILKLLDRRGVQVSSFDRSRIRSCDDLDTLSRWFDRAITAASIAEVFEDDSEH
ncbi:hypothetical protein AB0D78_16100 [Streptomyces avermitilis]|uniref:hypothetical protein n=1 Tax=Streptomyces avermitilis TaxID=33903 RepID=UPI0033EAD7C5